VGIFSNTVMKLAIIDLGTNSIRFDIYLIKQDYEVERLYRMKEMIRLGEEVFATGKLCDTAKQRCFKALDKIHAIMKAEEADRTVAFATSALRSAKNAKGFLKEINQRYDIPIQIISGKEEAYLIAKGILNNEIMPGPKNLFIDIGGGSTEISVSYKHQILDYESLDLGAARLTQEYLYDDSKKAEGLAEFEKHIEGIMTRFKKDFPYFPIQTAIGSSGSIRALAKILKKSGQDYEPFLTSDLEKLVDKMIPLKREELLQIPGLDEKRVDIILAGAYLYLLICTHLGVEQTYTTDISLRDGIIDSEIEYLLKGN